MSRCIEIFVAKNYTEFELYRYSNDGEKTCEYRDGDALFAQGWQFDKGEMIALSVCTNAKDKYDGCVYKDGELFATKQDAKKFAKQYLGQIGVAINETMVKQWGVEVNQNDEIYIFTHWGNGIGEDFLARREMFIAEKLQGWKLPLVIQGKNAVKFVHFEQYSLSSLRPWAIDVSTPKIPTTRADLDRLLYRLKQHAVIPIISQQLRRYDIVGKKIDIWTGLSDRQKSLLMDVLRESGFIDGGCAVRRVEVDVLRRLATKVRKEMRDA